MEAHFFQIGKSLLENTVSGNFIFNRLRAIWPKSYQRGSQEKSHQNGDYLKTSIAKKLTSDRNRTNSLWISGSLLYRLSYSYELKTYPHCLLLSGRRFGGSS